jgi:diguanylate cyclase (GGDEF)-like protein
VESRIEPSQERIGARLRPFAVLTLVALGLAAPVHASATTRIEYGLSVLAMLVVVALALRANASDVTWRRLARACLYLVAVAGLREATGGASGGVGIIVLVPVVWIALYGTPRMLEGIIAGVAVTWALPLVLIGAPRYPATGWRSGVLIVALAAIIGATVQRLVRQTREQAEEARSHVRERERLLAQVTQIARTDPLTGVANRRSWEEHFTAELAVASDASPVSIVVLDLDAFKALNDRFGHEAGDRCLRDSAASWRAQLRADDLLARIGGDEFAILLPSCAHELAVTIAERVRAAAVGTDCSVGVATWDHSESGPELQRRADRDLYAAKRSRLSSAETSLPSIATGTR